MDLEPEPVKYREIVLFAITLTISTIAEGKYREFSAIVGPYYIPLISEVISMFQSDKNGAEKYGFWLVFLSMAVVEAVLLYKLILRPEVSYGLIIAIIIIALLLILSPRVFDIESIKWGEFQTELKKIEKKLDDTDLRINTLFMMTMSRPMYRNLRKLESGIFGPYKMSEGLKRELYHLRDIGYIEVHSIREIEDRYPEGENLSIHVEITKAGREFVKLREKIESERRSS